MKRLSILCLIYLIPEVISYSQIIIVSGYVYQEGTSVSVPFANIANKRNHTLSVSDINGFYTALIGRGDTLEVSAIGFETAKLHLPFGFSESNYTRNVFLKKKTYILTEHVVGIMNYERFKQEFESMKLPEETKIVVGDPSYYRNYTPAKENFGYTFKGPFTALYNKFSRKAKEMQKLQDLMDHDNQLMIANMKLTRELVTEVTGLKGDDIDPFLRYCNMGTEFLARASKYDIMIALDRCYSHYTKDRSITPVETDENSGNQDQPPR